MICPKCGREYDGAGCPFCAAAVIPVIPDTKTEFTQKAPAIQAPPIQAAPIQNQSSAPVIAQQAQEESAAYSGREKKIIAVLSCMLIIMTAAFVLLLIDRSRLKADSEPETHKTKVSIPDKSDKGSKGDNSTTDVIVPKNYVVDVETENIDESNDAAKCIYMAAQEYADYRRSIEDIIPFGAVCSSDNAGVTSQNILNDTTDTVGELRNAVSNYIYLHGPTQYLSYEWIICFNDGSPTTVYAAPDMTSTCIGSYPTPADNETYFSMAGVRNDTNYEYMDGSMSANYVYG